MQPMSALKSNPNLFSTSSVDRVTNHVKSYNTSDYWCQKERCRLTLRVGQSVMAWQAKRGSKWEVGKGQAGGMELLKALGEWTADTWK